MRLAAIYIPKGYLPHIFGEKHKEITINLGGANLYNINNFEFTNIVPNEFYIDDILDNKISLLSCIVGGNGGGKTTILQLITAGELSYVIEHSHTEYELTDNIECLHRVYYTPYLNQSIFGAVGNNGKELSKIAMIIMDNHGDSGSLDGFLSVHNSENTKRWIKFNHFYRKQQLVNISLPVFTEVKLSLQHFEFTIHSILAFNDTPYDLRPAISLLFNRIKSEQKTREIKLSENKKSSGRKLDPLTTSLRFEYEVYELALGKFVTILERAGNDYLNEGILPEDFESQIESRNVREALEWLLQNSGVYRGSKKYYFSQHLILLKLIDYLVSLGNLHSTTDNWREILINEDQALKVIELYDAFNIGFNNDWFKLETKPMFGFQPQINISSGEQHFLNLFSTLYYHSENIAADADIDLHSSSSLEKIEDDILLLLDEGDNAFHPQWKKQYVKYLRKIVPLIFEGFKVQIIITTHDPLTLSDIPKNNVVFLEKGLIGTRVGKSEEKRTFAANLSDLLKDSFFLEDGQIGSYVSDVIDKTINTIRNKQLNEQDVVEIERIINTIDEPIIKYKLAEMLTETTGDKDFERRLIDEEIARLREKRDQI